MRLLPAALPAALVVFLAAIASAQPTPHVDPATAKKAGDLFKAGHAAADAGDFKTACDRFGESDSLQPAPGTKANLGSCEAKQGHLLAAREWFRKAGSGFKPDDERRAVAINAANDLTDRLAVVTVHVPDGVPPDTKILVQDAPLDPKILEKGVELDPGKTQIVVTATGHDPKSYELDLKEGEKREVTIEVGPVTAPKVEAPPPPPPSDDAAERRKLEHTLGYVGAGVGLGGVILGSAFGGLAFHEASVVKANCSTSLACNTTGLHAASSGSTDSVVSTVSFIAGGVFAAAGAYLLITTWGDDPAHPHPAQSSLTLEPVALLRGGGASATWTF